MEKYVVFFKQGTESYTTHSFETKEDARHYISQRVKRVCDNYDSMGEPYDKFEKEDSVKKDPLAIGDGRTCF